MKTLNKISFKTLLIFLVIGFLTGFDFTDSWGCVVYPHFFFMTPLSLLTLVSIVAIFIANKSKNSRIVQYILIGELVFSLMRLILFKGGYAVGFGGVPDPIIAVYDFLGIIIRIILIQKAFGHSVKLIPILLFAIVALFVKSKYFSIPPYYYYQEKRDISNGRKLQEKMVGEYTGQLLNYDTKQIISNSTVEFKKDSIIIKLASPQNSEAYYFLLESKSFGYIRNEEHSGSFHLDKFDDESMEFSVDRGFGDLVTFELKPKRNER